MDNEERTTEFASHIIQATISSCEVAQDEFELSAVDVAHHVLAGLMMFLAEQNDEDSLLVMVSKRKGLWRSHIHYDYLSSDHDHFKDDFNWGVPEPNED